jgi:hypothetical protein
MRGAEVAHPLAQNIFQRGVAIGQLLAHLRRRFQHQPGMSHRMVADQMSRRLHCAHDIRTLANKAPDHEERRAHLVRG